MHRREEGRFEITHVPAELRERDRQIAGRSRRDQEPILKRYERICFESSAIQPMDKPGQVRAVLMHPGHPLMLAVTDIVLQKNANLLRRGAVLVDPSDDGETPWFLCLLTHEVKSGDGAVLSKRMQFIRVTADGNASFAGWAPHLDLEPLSEADRARTADTLRANWLRAELEQRAVALATSKLVPEHFAEVRDRRTDHIEKTLSAVHERLTKEIDFWSDREIKLLDDRAAGKDVRLNLDNVSRTLKDLQYRLDSRKRELQAMRQVQNGTPVVLGGALVIPKGLLRKLRGEAAPPHTADDAARSKIERLAMAAVVAAERARGHEVLDVSAEKCGWDITSHPPVVDGRQPEPRHIEVKGRVAGADTITVTRNEILYAFNQAKKFWLAIVFVCDDDTVDGPHYLANPFQREPDWGAASVTYNIADLLARAEGRA